MKKGEVVEIVFTSVNGGRPSTDSSVLREDIKALLPAAINYVLTGDYWARIKNDDDREVPNGIVTELEFSNVCTDGHNREYLPFVYPVVNIGGNGGIRYVHDSIGNSYAPIPLGTSRSTFWDKALSSNREYQVHKDKIVLKNRPELTSCFLVGVILDSSLLEDNDELPIPVGSEPDVIDLLTNFFLNQRMQPKDYVVNGVDPLNEIR